MVVKFTKKEGSFGWTYLEGKVFETSYALMTDVTKYSNKHNCDGIADAVIGFVKEATDHHIIPGSPGFRFFLERPVEEVNLFTVIFQTKPDNDVDVYVFDSEKYVIYLMSERGTTIEKL